MSDDTARGISAPSFLNIPSAGPCGGPVLFSHDTVIIFGIVHIFSNVITSPRLGCLLRSNHLGNSV